MLKQIEINKKWGTYEEIRSLYATEKDVKIKIRLQIIVLSYEGVKSEDIGSIVKLTGATVRKHMKRYNRKGVKGLCDLPRAGGEPKMTDEEMIEIDKALKGTPRESGIEVNNWRGWVVQKMIMQRFAKEVTVQTCYNILHRLRYSKTRAKKQNKKRDPEEAEKFREDLEEIRNTKDEDTIILYEDEAIFTSEPTVTSVWTKVGEQPTVPTNSGTRKRTVIFGAVNPETGDFYEQFSPVADTDNFKPYLLMVSRETLPRKVILLADKASYHRFKGIGEWLAQNAPNISIMYFPTACSDLNSIELLWKDSRQNVTHNTLFEVFDCLIDALKNFFADLKDQPRKLTKLCPFIC